MFGSEFRNLVGSFPEWKEKCQEGQKKKIRCFSLESTKVRTLETIKIFLK